MKQFTRIAFLWTTAALLCALAPLARADGTWVNCVRNFSPGGAIPNYYQFFDFASISIGRDVKVGEAFGPWISANAPTAWSCTPVATQPNASYTITIQGDPPYAPFGPAIADDGGTYNTYPTANTQLGYIARWRFSIKGQTSSWFPLTGPPGIYSTPPESVPLSNATSGSYLISLETQIRFVRRAAVIPANLNLVVFDPIYNRHFQRNGALTFEGGGTYRISQMQAGGAKFAAGGTCTTPNVDVNLPTASVNEFKGIGSTAATKPFALDFLSCPTGLGSIDYRFDPVTSLANAANGVVTLDTTSSARGVGVQFLIGEDEPVQFSKPYTLTEYNSQQGGNYSIPMKARLYQTEDKVSAGSANSSITFTLTYK